MTVGELIHLLKDLPEDDEVLLEDMNWCFKPAGVSTLVEHSTGKEHVCIEMEEV